MEVGGRRQGVGVGGVGVGVGVKFPVCNSESRSLPPALPTHRQHHADSEGRPSQTSSDGRSQD